MQTIISLTTEITLPLAGNGQGIGPCLKPTKKSAPAMEIGVSLRTVRVTDCRRFVRQAAEAGDAIIPEGFSGISLWWWIRRRFDMAYCILADGKPRGIAGIYDAKPDMTAWVGLAIFDSTGRGLGAGSSALRLLAGITRNSGVQRLFAGVEAGNEAGLGFWIKNGFSVSAREKTKTILSADLYTLSWR